MFRTMIIAKIYTLTKYSDEISKKIDLIVPLENMKIILGRSNSELYTVTSIIFM